MNSRVGERGQITIPKVLRTRLGIRPGQVVAFEEHGSTLVIRKLEKEAPVRGLRGLLREPLDVDGYIAEARGSGYDPKRDGEP